MASCHWVDHGDNPCPFRHAETRLYVTADEIEGALARLRGPLTYDEGIVMVAAQAAADALRGNFVVAAKDLTHGGRYPADHKCVGGVPGDLYPL